MRPLEKIYLGDSITVQGYVIRSQINYNFLGGNTMCFTEGGEAKKTDHPFGKI